ncbi:MAG: ABC-2 transporter permease [Oscillospiraceae bacterium]|nr:ABC-2 transporter permease [Oscillospiraceae bacterium]
MKGLILKDLFVLKDVLRIYIFIFAFYSWMALAENQTGLLLAIVFVCSTVLPINALAYDERSRWDRVANTMPVSRREIVMAKYMLSLILSAISSVVAGIIMLAGKVMPAEETLANIFIMLALSALYQAVLMPIIYKFGSEKSRIIMMTAILVPWLGITAMSKLNFIDLSAAIDFMDANAAKMPVIIVAVVAAVYVLSVILSINIYKNKDL